MIRAYKTEGIVLKRRNFGEADRILTVLTKSNGKIQIKAPGVRRITSRRSSHIEPLNFSLLTLYKSSRASFPLLTEAQTLEDFRPIKNTLPRIGFAYYICELTDSLCPENQENRNVFFLLKDALYKLAESFVHNSIIDNFEDNLLTTLGFLPEFHTLTDKRDFIENIMERKLVTKRLLPLFVNS